MGKRHKARRRTGPRGGQSNRKGYGCSESAAQRRRASTSAVSMILNRQRAIKARVWRQAGGIFSAHGAPVHPGMGGEKEEERMAPPTAGRSDLAGGVCIVCRGRHRICTSGPAGWQQAPAGAAALGAAARAAWGHIRQPAATMAGSPRVLQAGSAELAQHERSACGMRSVLSRQESPSQRSAAAPAGRSAAPHWG